MRSYVLWLCDECGDHAESDPGTECEVCCEGTIRVVPVIPVEPVRETLESVIRNDSTTPYEYGEHRRSDDQKPARGTRWNTPTEIARAALAMTPNEG